VGVSTLAALLAGWAPIAFSIVTVFLFAGPHNWAEMRYMLGRLPARPGKLWPWFLTSVAGVLGLTAGFGLIPLAYHFEYLSPDYLVDAVAWWNTALIAWVLTLTLWRARQNPRKNWDWAVPVAFGLIALAWMAPYGFGLALVYLHPLMALVILDREIGRSQPHLRRAYRATLLALPFFAVLLYAKLAGAEPLPGDSELHLAITRHAGSDLFAGVSSHFLVALHTFLEMVHYAVWIVALPYLGWQSYPWKLETIPAARRSPYWKKLVGTLLVCSLCIVAALWLAFLVDYTLTRNIYFTIAMIHVLAEIPFLLRAA